MHGIRGACSGKFLTPCRHAARNAVSWMPKLGLLPIRHDGVWARSLPHPIRLWIESFPLPCAGIWIWDASHNDLKGLSRHGGFAAMHRATHNPKAS
jgi:hypothetical protein